VAKSKEAQPGRELSNGTEPQQAAPMRVGYARVSTADQSLALQEDALRRAGCGKIFTDTASGASSDRPGLTDLMSYLREGDTLVAQPAPLHLCESAGDPLDQSWLLFPNGWLEVNA
jgi:hypothetical protein